MQQFKTLDAAFDLEGKILKNGGLSRRYTENHVQMSSQTSASHSRKENTALKSPTIAENVS